MRSTRLLLSVSFTTIFILSIIYINVVNCQQINQPSIKNNSKLTKSTTSILSTTTTIATTIKNNLENDVDVDEDEDVNDNEEINDNVNINATAMITTTTIPNSTMDQTDNDDEEEEENSNEQDNEDDPWAEIDDDDSIKSGKMNIVDQMRLLREQGLSLPYTRTTSHLNETITRMIDAWHIIDYYYLPSKETWEKLLGLVTGLDVIVQPECFASYFQGVSGFRTYQTWAYRFLDVRGRFPESGTLHGKFSSFGEWEECLENLESPQNSATGLVVKSQYCMLEVKVPYPEVNSYDELKNVVDYNHPWFTSVRNYLQNFRLHNLFTPYKFIELLQMNNGTVYRAGLCIPHLCKKEEIENLLVNLTYPIFKMPLQLGTKCYKVDDPVKFKPHQLLATTIIVALICFVILCTVIEFYNISYDRTTAKNNIKLGNVLFQHDMIMKPNLFLYSFSAITNTRSLSKTSRFEALDSLKFLFMIYIHLYNYYNFQSTIGFVTLKRIFTTYPSISMRSDRYTWFRMTLPFEPIFIISGLVIGFNLHHKMKMSSYKFKNYILYLCRLWGKFAVTYIGSILFIYILPIMTQGPIWDYGMSWLDGCLNFKVVLNGLLFISNYNVQMHSLGSKHSATLPYCNPPTWLISVLIQLLIIAPIVIYCAFKLTKRMTYAFFMTIIIIGFSFNLIPFLIFGVKPDVHFLEFETLYETILSHSWYRYGTNTYIGCFLMGIMAGYLLVDFKVLLRFEIETTVLIISILLIQLSVAINNVFWRLDKPPSLILSLTWYTIIRFLSSVGFTSIFFLIASNRCSFFKRILDWPPLRCVSRLAYSYFMVHIIIIFYRIFSTKEVYSMTDSLMLQNFIIDVMFTLFLAYLFYCLVESPCVNLMNWCQGRISFDVEHVLPNNSKKHICSSVMDNDGAGLFSVPIRETFHPFEKKPMKKDTNDNNENTEIIISATTLKNQKINGNKNTNNNGNDVEC